PATRDCRAIVRAWAGNAFLVNIVARFGIICRDHSAIADHYVLTAISDCRRDIRQALRLFPYHMAFRHVTATAQLQRKGRVLSLRHELDDHLKLFALDKPIFVRILVIEETFERLLSLLARNLSVVVLVEVLEQLVIGGRLPRLIVRASGVARRAARKQHQAIYGYRRRAASRGNAA